ncbi:hypothetical protein H257_17606 [Aphanomyces astaci]|uniref:DUF659 domain-containing protein n=1 Tax=Aphanomyces astaci TaxID=112090 RepID=W4FFS2_APHAT|nr:hypothetical protein H257_17606 [Aphanomyces astaci]ETV65719.1 hypothetical protein H257_17606 [Aphanomyces astaci]|eukprot:XP_009844771.1 hypothetical protein H257_17606 [Aphanomyces astaci]
MTPKAPVSAFANIIFSTGVPFRFADSPALAIFVHLARPAYTPPSAKLITGPLLDRAHAQMENSMSAFMDNQPIASLVSDGWTSMRNDHMVNFVAVFPLKTARPVFVKAIATDDISQTGVNIAAELDRAIVAIEVSKVGSVVTDNAACMKSAWKILEQRYPGLICNGCAAHAVNLLIKDVCKLEVFANALERAGDVTSFVKDRNALTKRFERIQDTLLADGEISSKRAFVLRGGYTMLANTALFHDLKVTPGSRVKKAVFVDAITDATFWSNLQSMEATLRPTCSIIGKFEGDTCCLSDVYRLFLELRAHWSTSDELTELLLDRWAFIHTESMGFAYFLDPTTRAGEGMFEDDLYDNAHLLQEFVLVKKQISSNVEAVRTELANFVDAMKNPSDKAKFFIEQCATPMTYWHQVGSTKFPILCAVSRIMFSVPTSQAASQRVWIIYDFILTKRRNRLSPAKVTKLVQLYMNADLSSRGSLVSVMMGQESDAGESDDETKT